jgi:hypothetical protein
MKGKPKTKAAKSRPLFTIGYEQAKPAAVLNELKRANIEILVDTRAVAASRRTRLFQAPARSVTRRSWHWLYPFAEARHSGGRACGSA